MKTALFLCLFLFQNMALAVVLPNPNSKSFFADTLFDNIEDVKQKPTNPKVWLLAIAIEDYQFTDKVVFSKRSGEAFILAAQKLFGVSAQQTVAILDKDASKSNIVSKISSLRNNLKPGDTIIFYYSGHGIPDIRTREAYLLPVDSTPGSITQNSFFKLDNIYKTLQSSKASNVVAYIDACFSGSTDNKSLFKGVAAARLKAKKSSFNKTKMLVMTAGKGDQFSNQYEKEEHRLFSYFLIKELLKNSHNVKQIYSQVRDSVEDVSSSIGNMFLQTPTIDGNVDLKF